MFGPNRVPGSLLVAALTAAVIAVPCPVSAEEPHAVESIIASVMDEYEVPGAAAAIVTPDGIETHGLGSADVTASAPVEPAGTVFPVDSVTKTLTATVVMELVDDGLLDLDTDVNHYLDEVEVPQTYPGRPVTMRHLLTHTAGFEEQVIGILAGESESVEGLESHLRDHLPRRMRPPGELSAYSNYGLALAGLVAQDATGVAFDELVARRLLEPLGMESTAVSAVPPPSLEERAATLYGRDAQAAPVERGGDLLYPAGGAVSTAEDMGRFMRLHLDADPPLLSAGAAAELHGTQFRHDPRLPGMALAFHEEHRGSTRMLSHGGDGPGSHSLLTLVPEHGLGVFIVVNGDGRDGTAAVRAATERLLDLSLGTSGQLDGYVDADAPPSAAEAIAGTYRSSRMNDSDYTSLFLALGSDVTVTVGKDGTVATTGLSADPSTVEQHWRPHGEGLYRERNGTRLIAFGELEGRPMLYDGSAAYQRIAWYQSPTLHLGLAAAALSILLSQLAWPVAALVRRFRGRDRSAAGRDARAASVVAAATTVLATAFVAGMAALVGNSTRFELAILEGSPRVGLVAIPIALAVVAAPAVAVGAVLAWRRRWWGLGRRLHYTAVAVAALGFVAIAHLYHFTVASLTILS